jgi:4-phospho-D-threonate 3-dehydrogenase / 4-phospho-D-erythronate 3-dehydrogenase
LSESQIALPQLGITTGDPAGIGPEISLRAAQEECFQGSCRIILFGSWNVLQSRASKMGLPFCFEKIAPNILMEKGPLPMRGIVDIPAEETVAGTGSKASGQAAAQNIIACTAACLKGTFDGIVTAPINKKYFQQAGFHFPGHTEFLAHLAGAPEIAMAFLTERLKVVLATIHEPLKVVVATLSSGLIYRKLCITIEEFQRLGLPCKRVAVAGLNPHAGESGIMGSEDQDAILPGIQKARNAFPDTIIEGPLPGDTLFYRAYNGEFDVVLAMYHDQGLAPIKLIGFGESVNVTLGLPFIRTSVDHGTAYELAGKGTARHDSMNSAIRWAMRLAEGKRAFEKASTPKIC